MSAESESDRCAHVSRVAPPQSHVQVRLSLRWEDHTPIKTSRNKNHNIADVALKIWSVTGKAPSEVLRVEL